MVRKNPQRQTVSDAERFLTKKMNIEIYLKDPDALIEALDLAFANENFGLDKDEADLIRQKRKEKTRSQLINKWIECGEYYVVKINTEEMTAVLRPNPDEQ